MKLKTLILIIMGFCSFVFLSALKNEKENNNYYSQSNTNRTAAEWEPAKGTLIVWPLSVPYKLAVELAKDNHLYTMVEDEKAQKEASKWFAKWGIDLSNLTFIYADQGVDAWWTRDWGPSAVFTNAGELKLGDGKYLYATPVTDLECNDSLRFLFTQEGEMILTQVDDDASIPLAEQLEVGLIDLPFVNTGGNVLTDGLGTAFSSCVLLSENKYYGVENEAFFALNDSLLGFEDYHILSNFEYWGIQHIDCLMKLIDEETILVAQPPKDHELYAVYENIVENELAKLRTPYNRPYKIHRIATAPYMANNLAAYTNSLILNKVIYVPLFNIAHDSLALSTWKTVLPGYEVKGFTFDLNDEPIVSKEMMRHYGSKYGNYGWNQGDALHCRTRAIWDEEMLFISVKKPGSDTDNRKGSMIYASLIDYSKKGLNKNELKVFWRIKGNSSWNSEVLSEDGDPHHFKASIPVKSKDGIFEYYVEAQSNSGKIARRPATAPTGYYTYE